MPPAFQCPFPPLVSGNLICLFTARSEEKAISTGFNPGTTAMPG